MTDIFILGKIARLHGLKGGLKVTYAPGQDLIPRPGDEVLISSASVSRKFVVKSARANYHSLILTLEGIDSPEAARDLIGSQVEILAERQPLAEDEYYWRDIIGLKVMTEEGRYLGRVEGIFPTGSNDVFVCRDGESEILLPGIGEVIKKVDVENRKMIINLLPGLE